MIELQQLAEFAAAVTYEQLPAPVVARAQEVVRDTIAVITAGMTEPEVTALADRAIVAAPGNARLLGHGGRTTAEWAAFVHGTAGTTLEMDEGHAYARGHAAIHALPVALALAQEHGATGADALTGFVVGYEVAARAGVSTRLRPAVHPFGAWGVFGAAAVAAWFKRFDAQAFAGTLELAASYGISASFEAALQGANGRNSYAGVINRLGMLAADLYELGFRGERGGLKTMLGEILGAEFRSEALSAGLSDGHYEIMRGYFKPYSACRYTHAAVDAALALRAEGVDMAQVKAVEVETYDLAVRLADPQPETPLAGRFSVPYVVAVTLLSGDAGPRSFQPSVLQDPSVRELAQRVTVREDHALTALTPERRPARIRLMMKDGSQHEALVTRSKGDPDLPMSSRELRDKFEDLLRPVIGVEMTALAWERLGNFTELVKLDDLLTMFVPASYRQIEHFSLLPDEDLRAAGSV